MPTVLRRKQVDLDGWHFVAQDKMLEALDHLTAEGWRGAVYPVDGTWRLELNADNPQRHIVATIGDWLVDDMGLRLLTDAECTANYDLSES